MMELAGQICFGVCFAVGAIAILKAARRGPYIEPREWSIRSVDEVTPEELARMENELHGGGRL